jgi:hypothetical protein
VTARCGWCERPTDDYITHDIATDHGPAAVVWCRDWRACQSARAERPPQTTVLGRAHRRA